MFARDCVMVSIQSRIHNAISGWKLNKSLTIVDIVLAFFKMRGVTCAINRVLTRGKKALVSVNV